MKEHNYLIESELTENKYNKLKWNRTKKRARKRNDE